MKSKLAKTTFVIAMSLCVAICSLSAQTFYYTNGTWGVLEYTINGNAITITGFQPPSYPTNTTLIIPGAINSVPVTTVGDSAFVKDNLTALIIPGSVTSIGTGAFDGCFYLTNIEFGAGVTNIGSYAFSDCGTTGQAYFLGNAPSYGSNSFAPDRYWTACYLPINTGWSNTFAGLPTVPWNPPLPAPGIVIYSNRPVVFFTTPAPFPISLGSNYVLQMSTNLAAGTWVTVTNAVPMPCFQITNAPNPAFFRLE